MRPPTPSTDGESRRCDERRERFAWPPSRRRRSRSATRSPSALQPEETQSDQTKVGKFSRVRVRVLDPYAGVWIRNRPPRRAERRRSPAVVGDPSSLRPPLTSSSWYWNRFCLRWWSKKKNQRREGFFFFGDKKEKAHVKDIELDPVRKTGLDRVWLDLNRPKLDLDWYL